MRDYYMPKTPITDAMAVTNADRIRAMSDEKLAEAFFNLCEKIAVGTMNDLSDLYCDGKNGCIDKDGNITCTRDMEKTCVLRWLQQPVEEVSDDY